MLVCSRTRRQAESFSLLALDLVEHLADPARRDLDPVALGDRLVAVVVAGELQRHRLEAVLGDLQAGAVVEDRGAEHQLVVELGLDQDDVDAGIRSSQISTARCRRSWESSRKAWLAIAATPMSETRRTRAPKIVGICFGKSLT